MRNEGEQILKALRLCNYSEFYVEALNTCQPCESEFVGGHAFPLSINADTCTECAEVLTGSLDEFVSADTLGRITYLCNNADEYPRISSLKSN